MSIIRGVKDRRFNFVQLLNSMFEDKNISLKAKGFIGFCLTKKEDWNFHISHLCSVLKEGEDAIYSTIKECIDNGYAYRYRTRDEKGQLTIVEYLISDSKEEVQALKKQLDNTNEFNKTLLHRENPDVDNPRLENPRLENPGVDFQGKTAPIYSNTNSSNIKKQQQQASPVLAAAVSSFYKELKDIDIPIADKLEITNAYSIEQVLHAIEWSKTQKSFSKGLAAALKWACKNKPEIPISKEDLVEKNKAYAMKYKNAKSGDAKIEVLNSAVEIDTGCSYTFFSLRYDEKGFMDQFTNSLRKNNFMILE